MSCAARARCCWARRRGRYRTSRHRDGAGPACEPARRDGRWHAAHPFGVGYAPVDADRLSQLYSEARDEEWSEFLADCGKYLAELEKEESAGKYTLAELEEEEQSLDRLRRWYRELRSRDLLGATATTTATTQLKVCQEQFEQYAEHVYAALNGPHG